MSARYSAKSVKARKPGTLVYFGGGVHEVLADGHKTRFRPDLIPGSSKRQWKPKWAKTRRKDHPANRFKGGEQYRALGSDGKMHRYTAKKGDRRPYRRGRVGHWMQRAFATHKRGSLHRFLRVPLKRRIPVARLRAAERSLARKHAAATGAARRKLLSRLREVRLALTAKRIARRAG